MSAIKKAIKFVFDVLKGVLEDNIAAYSAHVAFFVTISFIPFIMLLISLLQYLPFTRAELTTQLIQAFPQDVWIKRVMAESFDGHLPDCALPYAGIAQQYLFYSARENKGNIA